MENNKSQLYGGIINIDSEKIKILYKKNGNRIYDVINHIEYPNKVELETPLSSLIEAWGLQNSSLETIFALLMNDILFLYSKAEDFGLELKETGYKGLERYVKVKDGKLKTELFDNLEKIFRYPDEPSVIKTIYKRVRNKIESFIS